MAINVFVSFDHTEQKLSEAFNQLKSMSKHMLETHSHHCKAVSADGSETMIACQMNDGRSKPIRQQIISTFSRCSKLVVLIGEGTYNNAWVEWEINNFYKMKDALSSGKAWQLIRGMSVPGCEKAASPMALECKSTNSLSWDPEALEKWLE